MIYYIGSIAHMVRIELQDVFLPWSAVNRLLSVINREFIRVALYVLRCQISSLGFG